jgi:tetratricopeptide (TPR) repeat protein
VREPAGSPLAIVLATAVAAAVSSRLVHASPSGTERSSVWTRVTQPEAARWAALAEVIDRKREPKDETYDAEAIRTQLNRAAVSWMELAGVERSDDVELLYLYGECLAFAGPEYAPRARDVLSQALSLSPAHPSAVDAWDSLGRVNMALGRYAEGYRAFERALETQWERGIRDTVLIEQGLGALRAADLSVAMERLRSANQDSREPAAWALSQWALAVAMDRALLGPEAERLAFTASRARFGPSGQQDVLSLAEVGLEPAAEVHYFRALAAMGAARDAQLPDKRARYLEAKFSWLRYLDGVGPTGPWMDRVRVHLSHIEQTETRLAPKEDDLHRQALKGTDWAAPDSGAAAVDPLWPEELEQGPKFWGRDDAGAPTP